MRRIPIQIDETTYRALKLRARREKRSIAAIVRESIARGEMPGLRRRSVEDFTFIGLGAGAGDRGARVSEQHDRALAAAFATSRRARHK